ncbi:extracellular solute-binding protein [Paenibacillus nasutitermitis]|uniref:HTH gntR-type domain-containing protein n=1 Tax=Paenibacillus nasutitermitis TaxID=1652958 RepID=A0A917DNV7_9BACL|nr:extracellular solute-binding protein [Paenibacillus nasutitermitis]GGD52403.1 hypothetical protein GCM10010911_07420 [Paenibacillus nasutitermitis]
MLKKRNEFQERYSKLRHDLLQEMKDGKLGPGDYLLSERELSDKYNLSHMSVRKLLAELKNDNLIEKIPGKGNRVQLSAGPREIAPLRVACYADSHERDTLSRLLAAYQNEHPELRIELIPIAAGTYLDNLLSMTDNGEAPDLWVISDQHFRWLIDRGRCDLLLPVSAKELDPGRKLYSALFDLFTDAKLRAVPFVFSPVVYCYNKDMISEAELDQLDNWRNLLILAERHTCKDEIGAIQQYGYGFSISNHRWPMYLLQNGSSFFSGEGNAPFLSNPATIEAFQFCLDLMYKYQVSPVFLQGNTRFVENLFMKNKVALITSTYYFMNEFAKSGINWDIAPHIPSHIRKGTLLLGAGLAIHSNSPSIPQAKRLIQFLIGSQAQTQLKLSGCTVPARISVAEDESLHNPLLHPKHYHYFRDVLPYAKPVKEMNMNPSKMEKLQEELFLMWMNMEKPEEACKRIDADWKTSWISDSGT